jgi:hypothetical protein
MSGRKSQKDDQRTVQTADYFGFQLPDPDTHAVSGHRRNPVNHQTARLAQAVLCAWFNRQSQQERFARVGGQRANRYGVGRIETIILNYDGGPRLSDLGSSAGYGPNLAAFHSSKKSEMASINA